MQRKNVVRALSGLSRYLEIMQKQMIFYWYAMENVARALPGLTEYLETI